MTAPAGWVPDLAATLARLGVRAEQDAPMGTRTTYRVGGSAALLVTVESVGEIETLASALAELEEATVMVLGLGSNMLVSDTGFPGVVVLLGQGLNYQRVEGSRVVLGGASPLPVASRKVAAMGRTGFEWAVGVPGSVGGAVRMNAGGHGSEMGECLTEASVFSLTGRAIARRSNRSLGLSYRHSGIGPADVVVEAVLELADGDPAVSKARISEIVSWRREHQPGGQNAGSVFVNPPGDHAARLVEACGLKGYRLGGAEVSPKHANFIQADPDAPARDVIALMALVRDRVQEEHGVRLHTEIRLIGFEDDFELPGEEGR
ncbi:MAG: UDP-N-acetylmuramate dehydrogenase [Actinomycetota bacterium]|nr:UDP-N-acetylmuramate dehydrogenase [Actinomycetota bacterium]